MNQESKILLIYILCVLIVLLMAVIAFIPAIEPQYEIDLQRLEKQGIRRDTTIKIGLHQLLDKLEACQTKNRRNDGN